MKQNTPAGQSRKASFLEAVVNVLIGYAIAVASQSVIFPLFNIHVSIQESMAIALAFTGVSIVRSYILRRAFNWVHVRKARNGYAIWAQRKRAEVAVTKNPKKRR